jgi:hypothetical protein
MTQHKDFDTKDAGTVVAEIKRLSYLHPNAPVFIVNESDEEVFCIANIMVGEHDQIVIRVKGQQLILLRERAMWLHNVRQELNGEIPSKLWDKYLLAFSEGLSPKDTVRKLGGTK